MKRVSSPGPKIPRKGILYWLILKQPTWAYEYSTRAIPSWEVFALNEAVLEVITGG